MGCSCVSEAEHNASGDAEPVSRAACVGSVFESQNGRRVVVAKIVKLNGTGTDVTAEPAVRTTSKDNRERGRSVRQATAIEGQAAKQAVSV